MAIQFKSAPAPAPAEGGGHNPLDFLALVDDNGKFTVVMLVAVVVVIYVIVTYLKTTPGHRVTDIAAKKRRGKGEDAVRPMRRPTGAPPPPPPDDADDEAEGAAVRRG